MPAPLWFVFLLGLLYSLFGTAVLPQLHLIAFAPCLAIVYNRTSFMASLWWAIACGIVIDLLSSELRFGLHTLNYCLVTLLLYKQKHHFFADKTLSLPLFTALISSVSTAIQLCLIYAFNHTLPFSWKLVLTDLIGMPLVDACYAYIWFSSLITVYLHVKQVGLRHVLNQAFSAIRFSKINSS